MSCIFGSGLVSLFMCVYKKDLANFSLQDRGFVSIAKRGQIPNSVRLCSV